MAEITIVRRASSHELQLSLTRYEYDQLFNGFEIKNGEPRIGYTGNARQGIAVWPSVVFDRGATRALKIIDMQRVQRKGGKTDLFYARTWLPPERIGTVAEFREAIKIQPRKDGDRLILPPTPPAWHGKNIDDVVRKQGIDDSRFQAKPPPPPPAPPPPPPAPADDGSVFELPASAEAFAQPLAPQSRLPAQTIDVAARRAAFVELINLAAQINVLMRRLPDVYLGTEDNRLVIDRRYRPGQARLRQ